jgi:Domain of unknown function (DUF4267)
LLLFICFESAYEKQKERSVISSTNGLRKSEHKETYYPKQTKRLEKQMSGTTRSPLEKTGIVLVSTMALLQTVYALYAFFDPSAFALLRGTSLLFSGDADWVRIYASRTLFIALIIGYLLYQRHYGVLAWAALFGTVMPITDALLAYQAHAAEIVVYKHIATLVYLLLTVFVL